MVHPAPRGSGIGRPCDQAGRPRARAIQGTDGSRIPARGLLPRPRSVLIPTASAAPPASSVVSSPSLSLLCCLLCSTRNISNGITEQSKETNQSSASHNLFLASPPSASVPIPFRRTQWRSRTFPRRPRRLLHFEVRVPPDPLPVPPRRAPDLCVLGGVGWCGLLWGSALSRIRLGRG